MQMCCRLYQSEWRVSEANTMQSCPLSVVVCTHNPRVEFLSRTLDALKNQTYPQELWQLVIIDNLSSTAVASLYDISWHKNGKHVVENNLGLTPARLRGVAETTGEVIVFVDDDNVLDAEYLSHVADIARSFPFLGAWGGNIVPEFGGTPPEWTRQFWAMLAIVTVKADVWSNRTDNLDTTPCGAGMCVRRSVADVYSQRCKDSSLRRALDRRGSSLGSCGDTDFALTACDINLGTGLFSRLKVTHIIPKERLSPAYLARLAEEMAYSSVCMLSTRGTVEPIPQTKISVLGWLRQKRSRLRVQREVLAVLDARQRGKLRAMKELVSNVTEDS